MGDKRSGWLGMLGVLLSIGACAPAADGAEAGAGGGAGGAPVWEGAGSGGTLDPMGTGGVAGGLNTGGTGGMVGAGTGGSGGMVGAGTGGMDNAGTGGGMTDGPPVVFMDECTPPTGSVVNDFGALGPFEVEKILNTGPSGQYTMVRPKLLGTDGFKHPPASWGNGITTTPDAYKIVLNTIASHGFVIIASNSTMVTADLVRQGLDWLIAQNTAAGPLQGQLAVDCAATIGYSLGGGAAVNAGSHPNVKVVASMHGLEGASESVSGPLLLLTSTDDGFVTKSGYVLPTYNRSSKVPTLMATLETGRPPDTQGHLIPLNDAGEELAPLVAWLRYWIYGDQGARDWFFGPSCTLCQAPWTDIQRKNHTWD